MKHDLSALVQQCSNQKPCVEIHFLSDLGVLAERSRRPNNAKAKAAAEPRTLMIEEAAFQVFQSTRVHSLQGNRDFPAQLQVPACGHFLNENVCLQICVQNFGKL